MPRNGEGRSPLSFDFDITKIAILTALLLILFKGINTVALHRSLEQLSGQVNLLGDVLDSALVENQKLQSRNDSLAAAISAQRFDLGRYKALYDASKSRLPEITPAICEPFSVALSACDAALAQAAQLQASSDSSIAVYQEQVKVATAALRVVSDSLDSVQDSLVAVSNVAKQGECAYDLGIFRVKCLGRTESLILGVAAGAGGVLWLTR